MSHSPSPGPPRLTTERLTLRIPEVADAAGLCAFANDNREHLAPWEPRRPAAYYTASYWKRHLPELAVRAREGSGFFFLLEPREEPQGMVQGYVHLSNLVRGAFQAAHLGYALDRRAVGRGIMQEALREVIRFSFEDLGLHRLMANYMPLNERSARVLRRLGFTHEGYARDYLLLDGAWRDHVLTALVNEAWRPPSDE